MKQQHKDVRVERRRRELDASSANRIGRSLEASDVRIKKKRKKRKKEKVKKIR